MYFARLDSIRMYSFCIPIFFIYFPEILYKLAFVFLNNKCIYINPANSSLILKVGLDSRPAFVFGVFCFFFKPACYVLFIGHEQ